MNKNDGDNKRRRVEGLSDSEQEEDMQTITEQFADIAVDHKSEAEFETEVNELFKRKDLEGLKTVVAVINAQSRVLSGTIRNVLFSRYSIAQFLVKSLKEEQAQAARLAATQVASITVDAGDRTEIIIGGE